MVMLLGTILEFHIDDVTLPRQSFDLKPALVLTLNLASKETK